MEMPQGHRSVQVLRGAPFRALGRGGPGEPTAALLRAGCRALTRLVSQTPETIKEH